MKPRQVIRVQEKWYIELDQGPKVVSVMSCFLSWMGENLGSMALPPPTPQMKIPTDQTMTYPGGLWGCSYCFSQNCSAL